jgi:7-cyano-7-deazaguanine synthase
MADANDSDRVAVLVSGGVDSAVLVAELCDRNREVQPLYVRSGLVWEPTELKYLRDFLNAVARDELRPLEILEVPVNDLYGDHWALTGRSVPDADSADEAVFLPGRNLFLIGKAAVWCIARSTNTLALGSLKGNPFGDSSPKFDDLFSKLVLEALGMNLPLERTFSCINPIHDTHCGRCNKCAERRRGFVNAGVPDKTRYCQ